MAGTEHAARPAVLIAGTRSGCGKTTVTLSVMAALCRRGLRVQPFKCGPDFIDPTLHQAVTGRSSRNLDVRMCGRDFVRATFVRHAPAAGVAVIEGVMGLFDGGEGSAARLATLLDVPVVLVVDVRSAAESVAAVVHGFENLDARVRVAGVVLNRVGSERHRQLVADAVHRHCRAEILGVLPREAEVSLPSRHLGLHMGGEVTLDLQRLAELAEEHLDLDRLLLLAGEAGPVADADGVGSPDGRADAGVSGAKKIRIGVARDAAFCFYYQDNLDMLVACGAELVFFSPLHDGGLPPRLDGLYLGGGYPELYAHRLSDNEEMRRQVRAFSSSGRPVYGECGGFMYLTRALVDQDGTSYPMAGIYPVTTRMHLRLRRLGYRRVRSRHTTILSATGQALHGHEFHYSDIESMPATVSRAWQLEDGRGEGYVIHGRTMAGYIHLHWGRTPECARQFVQSCGQGRTV
ncbi:cobyrinate a,c-diamide synthase [Thermodesulfobacteriota bacterium B35]